ncbi:hypothetical protein MNBD_UNCLBAC01-1521, partial [hydrothermal vent metagenome]
MSITKKELKIILVEGEGYHVEFKERFDKSIAKEIVAFTNATGGRIFLGVKDNGGIQGAKLTNKLNASITDIAKNCNPSIKVDIYFIEQLIVIEIFEGSNKPY